MSDGTDPSAKSARQLEAIAELGSLALGRIKLEDVLDALASKVVEMTAADVAGILHPTAGEEEFFLQMAAGCDVLPADRLLHGRTWRLMVGIMMRGKSPTIVEDLATERRFAPPALLSRSGIVSGASVRLLDEHGKAFALLFAGARAPKAFQKDDIPFLQATANIASCLWREGIHRVRLQRFEIEQNHHTRAILELMDMLQRKFATDEADPEEFSGRLSHLIAALLRTRQYAGRPFLHTLIRKIYQPYKPKVTQTGPKIRVPPRAVLPLSLALHELGGGSARDGSLAVPDGSVTVEWAEREEEHRLHTDITWRETGPGAPLSERENSLGFRLIRTLVEDHLGGELAVDAIETGMRVRIRYTL